MIIRVEHKRRYTVIDNVSLEDERLSYKALGVLAYLLSRPDSWEANYRHLATTHADGQGAVRSALQELEAAGYIERRREHRNDGQFAWVQVIHENPQVRPCGDSPRMAERGVANRGVENRAQTNTDAASTEEEEPAPADAGTGLALIDPLSLPWKIPKIVADGGRLEEAIGLCDHMAAQVAARGYRVQGAGRSKRWVLDMEALLRIDGLPALQIRRVLDWLDAGADKVSEFWRPNIQSPSNLRKHLPRLREQYATMKQRPGRGENFGLDRDAVDRIQQQARNGHTANGHTSEPSSGRRAIEVASREPQETR